MGILQNDKLGTRAMDSVKLSDAIVTEEINKDYVFAELVNPIYNISNHYAKREDKAFAVAYNKAYE